MSLPREDQPTVWYYQARLYSLLMVAKFESIPDNSAKALSAIMSLLPLEDHSSDSSCSETRTIEIAFITYVCHDIGQYYDHESIYT